MTPSFKLVNAEVKPLTPELALQFRDLEASPTERALEPSRIRMLREKAEGGHLVTFNWSVAKLGGRTLRMNGQHSSNMLSELNGQFPQGLKVHLDTYEVSDEHALTLLFRQFDDRKSGRTPGDVAGAYQGLVPALRDVPRDIAKLAVEGIGWYRIQIEGMPRFKGDDIYDMFNNEGYHAFIRWMGELFSVKTPEMNKRTVVAAIYGCFEANPTEAQTFWGDVARGGNQYEDNAPSTTLDSWLKSLKEGRSKTDLKPANYYQGCIYAWNGYREGRKIQNIKFDTTKGLHSVNE